MDRQAKSELDTLQGLLDNIHEKLSQCFTVGYSSITHIHMVASDLMQVSDDLIESSSSSSYVYAGKKMAKLAVINFKMRQIAKACVDQNFEVAKALRDEILTSIEDPSVTDSLEAA